MDQAPADNKPKGGSRGGRPRKQVRQDEQLALMCTRAGKRPGYLFYRLEAIEDEGQRGGLFPDDD